MSAKKSLQTRRAGCNPPNGADSLLHTIAHAGTEPLPRANAWPTAPHDRGAYLALFLTTPGRLERVESSQLLVLVNCATMVSIALNWE